MDALKEYFPSYEIDILKHLYERKYCNDVDEKSFAYEILFMNEKKGRHLINLLVQDPDFLFWKYNHFSESNCKIDDEIKFLEEEDVVEEGVITCKCGSNRTKIETKQTRSADEPMTVFVECVKCHSKWRI